MSEKLGHSRLDVLEKAAEICGVHRAMRWCRRGAVLDAARAIVLEPNLSKTEHILYVYLARCGGSLSRKRRRPVLEPAKCFPFLDNSLFESLYCRKAPTAHPSPPPPSLTFPISQKSSSSALKATSRHHAD